MGTVNSLLLQNTKNTFMHMQNKILKIGKSRYKEDHLVGTQTAWKVSKYGVSSGEYFPVFSPNTGKYGPEITPHWDTFHAVAN